MKQFADDFQKKHDALHILVNNAGAWYTERKTSPDGIELTFATNVRRPVPADEALRRLAQEGATAPSRVVNVVSSFADNFDGKDLEWANKKYDGFKHYAADEAGAPHGDVDLGAEAREGTKSR